jgi:tRNA threonylcarbamoyladenosine biosynthesis protein TsaB
MINDIFLLRRWKRKQIDYYQMSLILNIDTSTELASICLAKDGESIGILTNSDQKYHAGWIQPAIRDLLQQSGYTMEQLQAVAVTEGPGSYTGLRVGLSTAKGLCYALKIPLITENTLLVMAYAARSKWLPLTENTGDKSILLCPMIDARRMEVFTAVYDTDLKIVMTPNVLILDEFSFKKELNKSIILFFGSGSGKWKPICLDPHARFNSELTFLAPFLSKLAAARVPKGPFADLAWSEPAYLKEFYSYIKK